MHPTSTQELEACSRCQQMITLEDHHTRGKPVGLPGLHVRRWLCGCGCTRIQFYTVMDVSRMRSRCPYPDRDSTIPDHDFPIFKEDNNIYD